MVSKTVQKQSVNAAEIIVILLDEAWLVAGSLIASRSHFTTHL